MRGDAEGALLAMTKKVSEARRAERIRILTYLALKLLF